MMRTTHPTILLHEHLTQSFARGRRGAYLAVQRYSAHSCCDCCRRRAWIRQHTNGTCSPRARRRLVFGFFCVVEGRGTTLFLSPFSGLQGRVAASLTAPSLPGSLFRVCAAPALPTPPSCLHRPLYRGLTWVFCGVQGDRFAPCPRPLRFSSFVFPFLFCVLSVLSFSRCIRLHLAIVSPPPTCSLFSTALESLCVLHSLPLFFCFL